MDLRAALQLLSLGDAAILARWHNPLAVAGIGIDGLRFASLDDGIFCGHGDLPLCPALADQRAKHLNSGKAPCCDQTRAALQPGPDHLCHLAFVYSAIAGGGSQPGTILRRSAHPTCNRYSDADANHSA